MGNNTTGSIAERVAAGAGLLDEHAPGWADRIDIDRLNISLCSRCVLGQLYGDYFRGLDAIPAIGTSGDEVGPADYGFFHTDEGWFPEDDELTAAWRALIEQRQSGGAS